MRQKKPARKAPPSKTVTIRTYLAQPISGEPVAALVIEALEPLPNDTKRLLWASERHEEEGRRIADALLEHMPGGTVDQVLRFLLEHAASRLVVKHRTGGK